jgi:hypothetical protein
MYRIRKKYGDDRTFDAVIEETDERKAEDLQIFVAFKGISSCRRLLSGVFIHRLVRVQNVPVLQNLLGRELTMKPEIFSILATALERAEGPAKTPKNRGKSSVSEQKPLENLRQSSEDKVYVEDKLVYDPDLLMSTENNLIYSQINSLYSFPMKELRRFWREKMGTDSSPYMQKRALVERLAYAMQEQAFGGLSPEAQKRLDIFSERMKKGKPLLCDKIQLAPGTILSREYQNRKHVVKILEDEKVEYKGQVYTSLSAVARAITGTQWNGRKFFHVEESKE